MEARIGSVTVAALLGTGLATLGFALSGVSALGDDLHAARTVTPAPVLSPGEERDGTTAAPGATTPPAAGELSLEAVCDRERERRGGAGATTPDGADAKAY